MLWRHRSGSAAPSSSRLSRLLSDTWLWEIVSVILSGLFFALIIIILGIYNGKEVPQFTYGITLNAIISTLATFSKSCLLVAVAGSISQLKWHWYRGSEGKRLFDMQLFDDASRGPLGAIRILARVSRWPFVSVGAVVFVLVPAFDPFVQQVITYSTQTVASNSPFSLPSNTFRAENFIAQHKANDPYTDVDDLQHLVVASLWDLSPNNAGLPDVHCPTGNCTWPKFESLALCTTCEQRTQGFPESECPLSWDASEVQDAMTQGDTDFLPLKKTCTLELPEDLFCHASPKFTINAELVRSERDDFRYPNNVGYPNHIFGSRIILPSGERVPNGTEHPKLFFDSDISPTESWSLLSFCDLEIQRKSTRGVASLSVKQATVCQLSPCTQTYSLAVTNSTPNFSVLENRHGSWSFDATGLRYQDGKLYNTTDGLPYDQTLPPSWSHMVGTNGQYFNLANTTSYFNFNSPYSIKFEDLYPFYNLDNLLIGQIPVTDVFRNSKQNRYLNSSGLQFKEEYFTLQSFQSDLSLSNDAENLNLRQITKRGGLTQALPQIASRISNYIREKDGIGVPGQSFALIILVKVRWGWLSLPAAT
ncbi:hypothetical protein NPX13_g9455 [Xylaria arbuscula]|uniref:Uncharacterized protein n=1 Tax=Xylaria arbuscula TaxID=114810 RepID=A0A9W8TIW0_9PEZI|nr:hypothetical protein NPX13_g9455 [Xylaria arbuscula]